MYFGCECTFIATGVTDEYSEMRCVFQAPTSSDILVTIRVPRQNTLFMFILCSFWWSWWKIWSAKLEFYEIHSWQITQFQSVDQSSPVASEWDGFLVFQWVHIDSSTKRCTFVSTPPPLFRSSPMARSNTALEPLRSMIQPKEHCLDPLHACS